MDDVETLIAVTNEGLPVVIINDIKIDSFVKGYHVYNYIWIPKFGEKLSTEREKDNPEDKYAICVKEKSQIIGHLPLGKFLTLPKLSTS